MNILLSLFAVLNLYALSDGNYYLEDRNEPDPNIDEKHVGSLSTATPADQVKEKKITKYYKRMGVLDDDIWKDWLGKNYSEVYIIQEGDTLWDISDKFLDSPWYWPKIWEMNQYITNPHWIYPGNELKFTYSGTTGPRVTVTRRKKGTDYSILERDKVPSLFDENGFLKSRYGDLIASNNRSFQPVYKGGMVCLGEKPIFQGTLEASSKGTNMFIEDDELQVQMLNMTTCEKGARYAVVEERPDHIYKINGILEIQDKALKEKRCTAKVLEIYDVVKRDMHIINVPVFDSDPKNFRDTIIADVYSMEPYKKELGSEYDRICIKFRKKTNAPEPGTMVYFYEIKDPTNNKELDPYMIAAGQIIHANKSDATVLIVATQKARPITKKTIVTTRF